MNQETFLFDGSIRKNIAYGNKDCEEDDIIRAAEQSQCVQFISSLSDGYDTIIGERGQNYLVDKNSDSRSLGQL